MSSFSLSQQHTMNHNVYSQPREVKEDAGGTQEAMYMQWRHSWPGGSPFVCVAKTSTSSKSHIMAAKYANYLKARQSPAATSLPPGKRRRRQHPLPVSSPTQAMPERWLLSTFFSPSAPRSCEEMVAGFSEQH